MNTHLLFFFLRIRRLQQIMKNNLNMKCWCQSYLSTYEQNNRIARTCQLKYINNFWQNNLPARATKGTISLARGHDFHLPRASGQAGRRASVKLHHCIRLLIDVKTRNNNRKELALGVNFKYLLSLSCDVVWNIYNVLIPLGKPFDQISAICPAKMKNTKHMLVILQYTWYYLSTCNNSGEKL